MGEASWLRMGAVDLGRAIGAGEIDPVELCETYLAAIDAHPHRDRIYSAVTHDRARAEAAAAGARARNGTRVHALDGVPVSWKDLFDSEGIETSAGSALMTGRVPEEDARVLRNGSMAGLVCLGKTHMSELAFSGIGLNPSTATPPNINGEDLVPGGSSSGAAASLAFDLAAGAIGSDTGGSVRAPAAWNNLVGFKTSHGRISLDGVVMLAKRFDTVGPLAKSVGDAVQLLSAIEGRPAADLRGADLKGMRIAVLQSVVFDEIRQEPLTAYLQAEARLKEAGAVIEKVRSPELELAAPLAALLFAPEAYGLNRDLIESNPGLMWPPILERFRAGAAVSAPDYIDAWEKLLLEREGWNLRMAGYDAVICPTVPTLPPHAQRMLEDAEYYATENLFALRNTRVANMMGLPAITLPTGHAACGLMVMGKPGQDEALARVAAAAEAVL